MDLTSSPLNVRLRKAIENRIAAELSTVSGKASFWRSVGVGCVGLGVGCLFGLGFYGYSFVTQSSTNSELLTRALTQALQDVTLRGSSVGTVQLEPAEIALAKGQTVEIDQSARLKLDPAARVVADGEIRVQLPSTTTSVPSSPRQSPPMPLISNFTVFKSLQFDKGAVYTGWTFLTSTQQTPTSQYCYYTENAETPDLSLRVELSKDGIPQPTTAAPKGFDMNGALNRCVWFKAD